MLVTFGESFTRSGSEVAARTARTSDASTRGSCPNSIPPDLTCGQLAFTSSAATPGTPVSRLQTSA